MPKRKPARLDRHYKDRPEDYRQRSERDRDRILYTSALRRLAGVTQIVAAAEGHVFHNRLTHTLEVSQIGRRLAQKPLRDHGEQFAASIGGIDPEVVEASALAHDLGHPPFGHTAEEELDDLVVEAGVPDGFEGNAQSFRIVTRLAARHGASLGLNLTRTTLNAILKYPWFRETAGKRHRKYGAYRDDEEEFNWARELYPQDDRKSVEAELMDWADDIAYAVHDVEDFYRAGLIPLDRLANDLRELNRFLDGVFDRWKRENITSAYPHSELTQAFSGMINLIPVTEPYEGTRSQRVELRTFTARLIERYISGIRLHQPRRRNERRVAIEPQAEKEITMWKELPWHYVIRNPALATQQHGQRRLIRDLFTIFRTAMDGPRRSLLGPRFLEELAGLEQAAKTDADLRRAKARLAGDIVCGMTEQQAIEMHQRLTGFSLGSITSVVVR